MFAYKSFFKLGILTGTNLSSLLKEGYEISDCEYSFEQGIDEKGKASTKVFGGTIALTLPSLPSQELIDWSLKSKQYLKGAIITLDAHDAPQEKLLFDNAACIKMKINYALQGEAYVTTDIVIQAETLLFDSGIDFDNFWTKH